MEAHALPLMNDVRLFTTPPGLVQVDHDMNSKYGEGTAVRSTKEPLERLVKTEGDGKYFRRNLRLGDEPKKGSIRREPVELRLRLYRRRPQDPRDPFVSLTEEEVALARLPYRYRVLAETGGHGRVKILAIDELRAIRHRLGFPMANPFIANSIMRLPLIGIGILRNITQCPFRDEALSPSDFTRAIDCRCEVVVG